MLQTPCALRPMPAEASLAASATLTVEAPRAAGGSLEEGGLGHPSSCSALCLSKAVL